MEDNPIPNPNQEQETTPTTMDSHQSSIASFMEITSSSHQEALFFLESHNFDLDAAVSTFLESTAFSTTAPPPVATADATTAAADDADYLSPQQSSPSGSLSPSPSRSRSRSPPSGARSAYNLRSKKNANESSGRRRGTRGGGVRSLADLNRNSDADASDGGDDDDDDDDDDNPPQYYTGGQRSGMVVEDPSKGNDIESIFEQARRRAVQRPVDVNQPSSSSRSFTGTARLLSGELVSSSSEQAPEVVTHNITLWRNGFTVDDGPLRRFDDEENAPMLESIKNSECPKELQPADKKTAVHVNLVRRDENYHETKKPRKPNSAFKGVGRTLGTSSSTSSEPSAAPAIMNSAPSPVMGLVVDDKVPSTSIQLRLADGTRMVSRFNYHHTVRDIHAFIDASRPARVGAYTLQIMGFPPKPLTDIDQTIEEAGLANSVVIQKF